MAGSKTFLQPILDETVGGIQEAVDDVVEVVAPMPDKIDEQIDELIILSSKMEEAVENIEQLITTVGATATRVNIKNSIVGESIILFNNFNIVCNKTLTYNAWNYSSILQKTLYVNADGTLQIKRLLENLHFTGTLYNTYNASVSHQFCIEILKNNTSVYTKNISIPLGTTATGTQNINRTLDSTYNNFDDVLTVSTGDTLIVKIKIGYFPNYADSRVNLTYSKTDSVFDFGYELVDIAQEPIVIVS